MLSFRVSTPTRDGVFEATLDNAPLQPTGPYSSENANTFKLGITTWVALLSDSPLGLKPKITVRRFFEKAADDPIAIIDQYSGLAFKLRKSLRYRSLDSSDVIIESLHAEFKNTPVFFEYHRFYMTADPHILRYLLTFLEFLKKVEYVDSDLDTVAFRNWLEVEDKLKSLTLNRALICNLRPIVRYYLRDFEEAPMLPKHGNGAVAQRKVRGSEAKNNAFYLPKGIKYLYCRDDDPTPNCSCDTWSSAGSSVARLHFVPKTYKTSRAICMEPIPYMWSQQHVMLLLTRAIARGPLSRFVNLEDQSFNSDMAWFGSLTSRSDTVDLSSASDSVSWDLVSSIFPPTVLKHLLATRTSKVELVEGVHMSVSKFAPMGSAVCFPTQCIIYASVIALASICSMLNKDPLTDQQWSTEDVERLFNWAYPLHPDYSKGDYSSFRVYGDDLITDHRITDSAVKMLELLGFTVNISKSFTGLEVFRESCGGEFFRGEDVTPTKLKLSTLDNKVDGDTLAGLIDQLNLLGDNGYYHPRRILIAYTLRVPIKGYNAPSNGFNEILFSSDPDDAFAIKHSQPRNSHLRQRYNADLMRLEYRRLMLVENHVVDHSGKYDNYHYVTWQRARYDGSKQDKVKITTKHLTRLILQRMENGSSLSPGFPDESAYRGPIYYEPRPAPSRHDTLGVGVRRRWTAV